MSISIYFIRFIFHINLRTMSRTIKYFFFIFGRSTVSFDNLKTSASHTNNLILKQGGIKYHFLSLWYNSTWDWALFFHTIGEHSTHLANGPECYTICNYCRKKSLKTWKKQEEFEIRGRNEITFAQSVGADCTSAEGKTPPNKCPGYDKKQSDGEVPVMLELWGMRSTPSLSSLWGPLWPGVVAPDRALSMG